MSGFIYMTFRPIESLQHTRFWSIKPANVINKPLILLRKASSCGMFMPMKKLIFSDRDQFMEFGEQIAGHCKSFQDGQPAVIGLNGDLDSRKSLLALAINKGFYPARYPHGISMLEEPCDLIYTPNPSIFFDDCIRQYNSTDCFGHSRKPVCAAQIDWMIDRIIASHPSYPAYVMSNIGQGLDQQLDFGVVKPTRLDLGLQFQNLEDERQQITISHMSPRMAPLFAAKPAPGGIGLTALVRKSIKSGDPLVM